MKKGISLQALIIVIICGISSLSAEVEKIAIKWNPIKCQTNCPILLSQQFKRISGVAEVNVTSGEAELKWKPYVPFSLPDIKVALQMVGISIVGITVHVKVNGTIQHTQNEVTLVSSEDGTHFVLLNPVLPSTDNRHVIAHNFSSRQLTPEMRQKFLDAEINNQIATVEGPIFMPQRTPPSPLAIVVDQVSFCCTVK